VAAAQRFPEEFESRPRWYAIHTRARHEKVVARQLLEKEFPAFLPLRLEVHRWKNRYKKVEVPLFTGYVFAQFPRQPGLRLAVLKTPGVLRIVGFGQRDTPVPDDQIEALQRVLSIEAQLHPHHYLRLGQRVKVISGALAGVEGILVRVKKSERLVIAVGAIRQAVALELSGYEVVPIS
jgi:transcription antitermination factor NusG